jgi:uncharacterized protein (DUF1697 family)
MPYVAASRINVGSAPAPMAAAQTFSGRREVPVETYIQSGNVVFEHREVQSARKQRAARRPPASPCR